MTKIRCIVIGAGFSGLLIVQKLKATLGDDVDISVFEKNADVGGTWLENKYPGCACDVPSHIYQYSFAPNPYWSRPFASSSEIQNYLRAFTKYYNLKQYISFSHTVKRAEWHESRSIWSIQIEGQGTYECDILINAGGILNNPNYPKLSGLNSFRGDILHTAAWDTETDIRSKRVAVIGAGASAIQLLPAIQPQVSHVDVHIRTPSWITKGISVSGDKDPTEDYTEDEIDRFVNDTTFSLEQRKQMEDNLNGMWKAFFKHGPKQKELRAEIDTRMREIVQDKQLQEQLIPKFEVGCRRLNPGEPYLVALQEPNVQPIFDQIEEITPFGIRSGGQERKVDTIILATGFDTSFRSRFSIIGSNGVDLRDLWQHDPVSYLGIAVSGFPNYLIFLGPNTPISNGSVLGSLEATADHFVRLITKLRKQDAVSFDVWPDVQADFDEHTQEFMKGMVWSGTCRSWYKRGEKGKVTAIWPGSSLHYREVLEADRFEDYRWKYRTNRFAYWRDGHSKMELDTDPSTRDLSYYIKPHPNLPANVFRPETLKDEPQRTTGVESRVRSPGEHLNGSAVVDEQRSELDSLEADTSQKGAVAKVVVKKSPGIWTQIKNVIKQTCSHDRA